jgi:hypothetical protein
VIVISAKQESVNIDHIIEETPLFAHHAFEPFMSLLVGYWGGLLRDLDYHGVIVLRGGDF